MASRAGPIIRGGAVGLLGGLAGAAVCAALFIAFYRRGGVGDMSILLAVILAFGAGVPLGVISGIGWSFTELSGRYLFAGLVAAGVLGAVVELGALSSARRPAGRTRTG